MATSEANHSRAICHARAAPLRRWSALLLVAASTTLHPAALEARQDSSHVIKWWHGAVAVGGIAALMLLDPPVQRYAQDNSGTGADNVASVVRHFGQPEVYVTVTVGLAVAGLAAGDSRLVGSAKRVGASLLLAGATTGAAKFALGRARPEETLDATSFSPFSGQDAMPSGHTAMAFALATSLGDEIHRTWASVGLYGLATAVGWSRINDNRHWLTDVVSGALVGITSAKLVSGRWRIFNLRPPAILATPGNVSIAWQGSF
jgi:membrane-associated phospholipid phosphatase